MSRPRSQPQNPFTPGLSDARPVTGHAMKSYYSHFTALKRARYRSGSPWNRTRFRDKVRPRNRARSSRQINGTPSRRSPASNYARPTAGSMAAISCRRCRPTSTAPATISICSPPMSCRPCSPRSTPEEPCANIGSCTIFRVPLDQLGAPGPSQIVSDFARFSAGGGTLRTLGVRDQELRRGEIAEWPAGDSHTRSKSPAQRPVGYCRPGVLGASPARRNASAIASPLVDTADRRRFSDPVAAISARAVAGRASRA
jgi:hypothetical protein